MMKYLLSIGNSIPIIILSSLFGAAAISYIQATLTDVLAWIVPMAFVVMADLGAGIRAAKHRGETIRFSTAARRTLNKFFCYGCWIFTCVALNERYDTKWCAWVGMGIVFLIEGLSFLTNVLEPHGVRLSLKAVLDLLGGKIGISDLGNVIDRTTDDE